jgi:hypothetical protein
LNDSVLNRELKITSKTVVANIKDVLGEVEENKIILVRITCLIGQIPTE